MNSREIVCYNTDASRAIGKAEKVIFPKNIEEIQEIIRKTSLDIVPRGAGTSLVGGAIPNNSVVVDLGKMHKILKFDKEKVHAEAGITLKELNEKLSSAGFEFPIHPFNKNTSTIGGMIATDALGERSIKYGMMKDWVEEIELVNGKGELMKLWKNDLTDICGREGITGIIVSAKLRVTPKIKRSFSIFQGDNLDNTLSIARRLKSEKEVVMLKFLSPKVSELLGFPKKYHIIIEFDSERGKIKGQEYENLSKLKDKVYYALASEGYYNSEDPKFFSDKIKEFVLFLEENGIPYFGYLGTGIIISFFKDEEINKKEKTIELIKKMKAKPGVYGIGLKRKYLLDSFEERIIQRIKLRYDPFEKINNGKIIGKISEISYKKAEDKIEKNKVDRVKLIEKEEEIDEETKERLLDYEATFKSELAEEKKREVEEFSKNIAKEIASSKKEADVKGKITPSEKDIINKIMTNRFKGKEKK